MEPRRRSFLQQLVAVALRQHDVEHDQVHLRLQRHAQPDLAVGGHAHLVAVLAQVEAQAQRDGAIVFDDEDAGHGGHAAGSTTRKVLPSPSRVSSSILPPCSLDDLAGDGEAETGALGLAREQVVGAVEALEDAFSVLGPHAGSVVLHLDGDAASRPARAQADALVLASVLERIVNRLSTTCDMASGSTSPAAGAAPPRSGRRRGAAARARPRRPGRRGREPRSAPAPAGAAALQPRPVEQLLHQPREAFGFAGQRLDALAHLVLALGAPVAQRLGEAGGRWSSGVRSSWEMLATKSVFRRESR